MSDIVLRVKKLTEHAQIPVRATPLSAGYDLFRYGNLDSACIIKTFGTSLFLFFNAHYPLSADCRSVFHFLASYILFTTLLFPRPYTLPRLPLFPFPPTFFFPVPRLLSSLWICFRTLFISLASSHQSSWDSPEVHTDFYRSFIFLHFPPFLLVLLDHSHYTPSTLVLDRRSVRSVLIDT